MRYYSKLTKKQQQQFEQDLNIDLKISSNDVNKSLKRNSYKDKMYTLISKIKIIFIKVKESFIDY